MTYNKTAYVSARCTIMIKYAMEMHLEFVSKFYSDVPLNRTGKFASRFNYITAKSGVPQKN